MLLRPESICPDESLVIGYTIDGFLHWGRILGKGNICILEGYSGVSMPLVLRTPKGIAKMIKEGIHIEVIRIEKRLEEDARVGSRQ